jgi:hypothetical protein
MDRVDEQPSRMLSSTRIVRIPLFFKNHTFWKIGRGISCPIIEANQLQDNLIFIYQRSYYATVGRMFVKCM